MKLEKLNKAAPFVYSFFAGFALCGFLFMLYHEICKPIEHIDHAIVKAARQACKENDEEQRRYGIVRDMKDRRGHSLYDVLKWVRIAIQHKHEPFLAQVLREHFVLQERRIGLEEFLQSKALLDSANRSIGYMPPGR